MASGRSGPPALGHEGSKILPPGPQVDSHHTLPYTDSPKPAAAVAAAATATAASGSKQGSGWWSLLAGATLHRKNSVGFSEDYSGDSAPPFCLDEDSSSQKG